MSWSQTLVVWWAQFVVAAGLLLVAARVAMRWIVQPADRIRLIQCTWTAAVAVPVFMACVPIPAWRLGLISAARRSETTSAEPARRAPEVYMIADARLPIDADGPPQFPLDETDVNYVPQAHAYAPSGQSAVAAITPAPALLPSAASRRPDIWLVASALIALVHGIAAAFFLVEWIFGRMRLRD